MAKIPAAAEAIIRESPQKFNSHRKISSYYDTYTAQKILRKLHEIPDSVLMERLIRNPFRCNLQEDLRDVLTGFWTSGVRVASAFICEPLVFTIFW